MPGGNEDQALEILVQNHGIFGKYKKIKIKSLLGVGICFGSGDWLINGVLDVKSFKSRAEVTALALAEFSDLDT